MRKTLCLFLVILSANAAVQGQVRKEILVTQDYIFMTLYEIFNALENRYDIEVDFSEELIPDQLMRSQRFDDTPLTEVFETLLADFNVDFTIRNYSLVIIREKGAELIADIRRSRTEPTRFNFRLEGTIEDFNSGETLPFATILVVSDLSGAATNVDGYFTLLNIPSDTSTVLLQYLGYKSQYVKLEPEMIDENNFVRLTMEPLVNLLEEIVVTDQKEHMIKASEAISKVSVSPAQLSALPSIGEKDIFRSLQMLPGVSGTNETSSGLYVRGGTPDQNLVLFDGFTVYHVDHFYGFFSAFNANAIKNVQLYKGGFEAKYGGRVSSVVDLTGKNGNVNRFQGSVGVSALSVNASMEAPFADGKGSSFFSFRRSYTDIIQSGLYSNLFNLFEEEQETQGFGGGGFGGRGFGQVQQEPSFYFYDMNAKVTYRPSNDDIVSFSFYTGQDKLDNSDDFNSSDFGFGGGGGGIGGFANNTVDLNNWGNVGSSIKWGRQWNPRFYTNSVVSYSNYFSDREEFSSTDITREDTSFTTRTGSLEDNNIQDISLKIDNEYLLNANNMLSFGAQFTYNDVEYNNISNDTTLLLDRDDTGLTSALYLQNSWTPGNLMVNYGLRLAHYSNTEQFYPEPRFSATYSFNDQFKVKGAWGLYNQFVTRVVREDVSQGSRDFWLLADNDLNTTSSSTHYILGASYETTGFLFDVEAFYKDLRGLSEYTLRFTTEGTFRDQTTNLDEVFYEGDGYSQGIEFLAQKKFGKYTGWVGYTISEVIHEFEELSEEPFPALHDQTHELKFVNSLRLGRLTLSGTWVYATGKPYTSPTGGYEITYLDGTSVSYIAVGEKNAYRLPDYHRLDLSAVLNIPFDEYTNADVGFSIFNLYNRSNVWYKTFEIIDGDFITTDVNTIGITPNLFFTINF